MNQPDLERVTKKSNRHSWARRNNKLITQVYFWAFLLGFSALQAWGLILASEALQNDLSSVGASQFSPAQKDAVSAVSGQPDPCGLKDVVCAGEKKVINATVTTYQAVESQTDSTPCDGAMPGIDFCHPPFEIVANNCLKLGTKVWIEETQFVVADRMNPRYGCNYFDILIMPYDKPFKLTNEPVTVL